MKIHPVVYFYVVLFILANTLFNVYVLPYAPQFNNPVECVK